MTKQTPQENIHRNFRVSIPGWAALKKKLRLGILGFTTFVVCASVLCLARWKIVVAGGELKSAAGFRKQVQQQQQQ
jgi:hypothetical protein